MAKTNIGSLPSKKNHTKKPTVGFLPFANWRKVVSMMNYKNINGKRNDHNREWTRIYSNLGERGQPAKRAALMLFRPLGRRVWRLAKHMPAFCRLAGAGRETHPAATGTVALPRIGFQSIRVSSRFCPSSSKFRSSLCKSLIFMKVSDISRVSLIEGSAKTRLAHAPSLPHPVESELQSGGGGIAWSTGLNRRNRCCL